MRRRSLLLATAVSAFLFFFSFSFLVYGYSPDLVCSVPTSYATLQAAIDDSNCTTITVDAGTYTEYVTINRDVVIEGAGAGTTIFDGQDAGRPFTINSGASYVTLRDFGIENGLAATGGAIFNESVLTLDTLFLNFNSSTDTGGAIYSTNDLAMKSSFFQVNDATSKGGAIYVLGTPGNYLQLDISNTTFMVNDAGVNGGGLYIEYAETNLTDTYFDQNTANTGGGIYEFCGEVTMIGGSAANNQVVASGGFYYGGCGLDTDVATFWNTSILQNLSDIDGGAIYRIGKMEIHNSSFTSNIALFSGGAIHTTDAEIYDSYLGFNIGDNGSAVYVDPGDGEAIIDNSRILANMSDLEHTGAIYAGSGVSMTVRHSEINMNDVAGIYNAGTLSVVGTEIMTNTRGIYHASSIYPATVTRSTIADNILTLPLTWHNGAGIRSLGPLIVRHSTINNNHALQGGGGISSNGPMTLTNVTISGNSADDSGGGIWHNNDDPAILKGTTIYDNVAGDTVLDSGNGGGIFIYSDPSPDTVTIHNSIIAENRDRRNADGEHPDCSGIIDTTSYTLFGIDTGCTIPAVGAGKIVGTSASPETADLNPLADNGGATVTHEPEATSPALDSGYCTNLGYDQRGVERVTGVVGCDMGAYEDGVCPSPVVTDLDINLLYGNAELQWTRDTSLQRMFKVYYSDKAYLDPIPTLIKRTIGDRYLYSNANTNSFFSVRAGNACGDFSARDAVGVMAFDLVPGS